MKYSNVIRIDLPRERVVELFDSSENLKKWQPGLISFDHLSGKPGEEGAKAKLVYQMGRRRTEMIETITANRLPDEFHGTYDAKGVHNIMENYFKQKGPNITEWTSVSEFQFSSFSMKLMGWLMPGAFKKQSYKYMRNFKKFAESEGQS